MLKISKVENDKQKLDFIKLPWQIYKNDKYWVPPLIFDVKNNLDPKKNPFFEHSEVDLFLAEDNGKYVGRIAAIKNDNHNKFHNDKSGFFGFFECIDNQDIADQLLNTVCEWCNNRKLTKVLGPFNPSTNDECGLLVQGFDSSPVILMTYNPPYYQKLIEEFGFTKEIDLYAYFIPTSVIKDEKLMIKLERMANMIKSKQNIVTRTINMNDFMNEVRKVEEIYNNAWELNWGFVPMTTKEFDFMAKSLKMIVDPDFVFFAEVDGKPAGFVLSLPDINQVLKKLNGRMFPFGIFKYLTGRKKIDLVRIITMGVKKEYQKRGIDSVFYLESIKAGNRKHLRGGEISWVLENNMAMRQSAEKLGAYIYKTYRIFGKELK